MTLTTPAPGRPITSSYGWRTHPVTGRRTFHRGIDFGGTFPVLAASDGTVIENAFAAAGLGYFVGIQHTPRLRTYYGHGAARSKLTIGQTVRDGDDIYTSGSTGLSTGPHLHFEVRVRNWLGVWVPVDPAPYLTSRPNPNPAPPSEEDDMKDSLLIWTRHKITKGMLWAHVSHDLARFIPIFKQDTANALAERIGSPAIEVAGGEWNGYRLAAGLPVDPNV
jgi:hypothetical protein